MKQFDKHAGAYDAIRRKASYPPSLYENLASLCSARESALDIGCGNGVSTIRLKPYFSYVEGSDLGESLIELARVNYPGIRFSAVSAERYRGDRRFDLVTSATSFYWMDRAEVLRNLSSQMSPGAIFCAYKYDFPIVYGPIRDVIESELAMKWSRFRDARLTRYDDTLEVMRDSGIFVEQERRVYSNIIELTPLEVALFFLSTSYVTRYIDQGGVADYRAEFMDRILSSTSEASVKANFDVHAFIGRRP